MIISNIADLSNDENKNMSSLKHLSVILFFIFKLKK